MTDEFDAVVVDIAKLRDYCLSATHFRGRHKARVFRSRLSLTANDAEQLRDLLLQAVRARAADLRPAEVDRHGLRFLLDFEMRTSTGAATVRSAWIVRASERVLRLTSCYIL